MKSLFFIVVVLCVVLQVHAAPTQTPYRCQMELYCTGGSVGAQGSGAGKGVLFGTSTSYRRVRVNELATGFTFVSIDGFEQSGSATSTITVDGDTPGTTVATLQTQSITGCTFMPATVGETNTDGGVTCTTLSTKEVEYVENI
mmetsp:Transcript_36734/g.114395  ORF Transcript_36734/g.114395 Transcript_36734/m.114395 type:complete len:143 (-) Transcript_36734:53-481(-)